MYIMHMLYELLTSNRAELISRCKGKVARRFAPSEVPVGVNHGVPLFLEQLADALRLEQNAVTRDMSEPIPAPAPTKIGRAAALHGAELLRRGYSVDQVVHDYGDVCQSVTELAAEQHALVTADEFRTLNRCLDDAIADAVTAFAHGGQNSIDENAEELSKRLNSFSDAHERTLDLAILSFSAIQTGTVGPAGTTGAAHKNSLLALRSIFHNFTNQIRLASTKTTLPLQPKPPVVN